MTNSKEHRDQNNEGPDGGPLHICQNGARLADELLPDELPCNTQERTPVQDNLKETLLLATVEDLLECHFFVAAYQRGYRWTSQEVEDLLRDISEFDSPPNLEDSFYCLQPLTVKYDKKSKGWELIDGQQRITTIYLILAYLRNSRFTMTYGTRLRSSDFLSAIDEFSIGNEERWSQFTERTDGQYDNIDNFHFFEAWKTIGRWFLKADSDKGKWLDTLLTRTKVIWYEPQEKAANDEKPIEKFRRINSGKILLTNSELIRALLFKRLNKSPQCYEFKARDIELSNQWDEIEHTLQGQEDAFWYFIYDKADRIDMPNRIEFLFDIIADKPDSKEPKYRYFTFRHFSDSSSQIKEQWERVRDYFSHIQEWFEDNEKYHLVGYLVTCGIHSVGRLLRSAHGDGKPTIGKMAMTDTLESIIHNTISSYNLKKLRYNEHQDKLKLQRVLLLFNIEECRQSGSGLRFSFLRYRKDNRWTLEHIHAQNSEELPKGEEVKAWYIDTRKLVENYKGPQAESLMTSLEDWSKMPDSESADAKSLRRSILKQLYVLTGDVDDDVDGEGIHSIDNLALLDRDTNSGLNNAIFPVKRSRLIQRDRQGKFIPIATRNVFLKYYTPFAPEMYRWTTNDRNNYLNEIVKKLHKYGVGAE